MLLQEEIRRVSYGLRRDHKRETPDLLVISNQYVSLVYLRLRHCTGIRIVLLVIIKIRFVS